MYVCMYPYIQLLRWILIHILYSVVIVGVISNVVLTELQTFYNG